MHRENALLSGYHSHSVTSWQLLNKCSARSPRAGRCKCLNANKSLIVFSSVKAANSNHWEVNVSYPNSKDTYSNAIQKEGSGKALVVVSTLASLR